MPISRTDAPTPAWPMVLLSGLALSIGWGIRGNFGHEFGAMIAGALAALAVALTSGREDWRRRSAYFAMLGALGWSFGGSMSYMQVVAYTHSGDSASVLYGFACLFAIGFLWAFPGGVGTALAATLDRPRLIELVPPIAAVLCAWSVEEIAVEPGLVRHGYGLNWFDTDWTGALGAIMGVSGLALARRRLDRGSELVLHMALGWWAGFLLFPVGLGVRMTPPRGDNWAGCLGLCVGVLVYCQRQGLVQAARAGLVTGFLGGIGFASASMLKLVEVTSGYQTNWHSILEQTTGLFNGLALAVAMRPLARSAPTLEDDRALGRWTEVFAVGFVLVLVTYLNLRKNPGQWIRSRAVPEALWGLPTSTWFNLAYLCLAAALLVPLVRHLRRPLPLIPASPLGRGQWLALAFLWWMVVGNFERALVGFASQRLVTEGVILAHAALLTVLILLVPDESQAERLPDGGRALPPIRRIVALGIVAAALSIVVDWGVVRAIYGDRFAGHAALHIRFGPRATTGAKPGP